MKASFLAPALSFLLSSTAFAQSGGGFELTWHTVEGGGRTFAAAGGFSLGASVGQADAADGLAGGAAESDTGFWPGVCGGHVSNYGAGCPGTGGFVPKFTLQGCPANGYDVVLDVGGGNGGALVFLFLGLGPAALPMGGGCTLNVFPLFPTPIGPFPLSAGGPGAGAIQFPVLVPTTVTADVGTVYLQAFVSDPGAPGGTGFSNSEGVAVSFGA